MSNRWKAGLSLGVAAAMVIAVVALLQVGTQYQHMGVTRFRGLHVPVPTSQGTATPGLMVDSSSVANPFEVRVAATPKWYIDSSGNAAQAGTLDVQGGDITMENDETLSNSNDGVVQIGGYTAFSEGSVIVVTYGSTITPTASFQPITSTAAITNAILGDGSVAGQLLVMDNENAADDITIDKSECNLESGGDVTLDGGNDDALYVVWNGAKWLRIAFGDN